MDKNVVNAPNILEVRLSIRWVCVTGPLEEVDFLREERSWVLQDRLTNPSEDSPGLNEALWAESSQRASGSAGDLNKARGTVPSILSNRTNTTILLAVDQSATVALEGAENRRALTAAQGLTRGQLMLACQRHRDQ